MNTPIRIEVYKETQDNWCPNFTISEELKSLVRLSLIELLQYKPTDPKLYRVSVWGADDCGMEKDYITLKEAYDVFSDLVSYTYIDKPSLKKLGFISA